MTDLYTMLWLGRWNFVNNDQDIEDVIKPLILN